MKILLFTLLAAFLLKCGGEGGTTGGVRLTGEPVSHSQKVAVENGLLTAFEKARCRGYSKNLELSDYTVRFMVGGIDSDGNPALKIPCGDYCGTTWDKGGFILIAGMVQDGEIVLPVHNDMTLPHLAQITEYEAEHIILKANDKREYERTKVHGYGTGHPIILNCGQSP
jgi:hypothetical protein